MCQYSSHDGHPTDWHLVHLGSFARGGCGLVMTEATAVAAIGRISPVDAGIWNDDQARDYERITGVHSGAGSRPGIQLAHAGRKASTSPPWTGRGSVQPADGGWETMAPSPIAFGRYAPPKEMTIADIRQLIDDCATAAGRALAAGFDVIEIHAAHGYLLHEFLSPVIEPASRCLGR